MDGFLDSKMKFSRMTREEALTGKRIPRRIKEAQDLLDVEHFGFDGRTHDGQILVHRAMKKDVASIFATLFKWQFPINTIVPISAFGWSDAKSMAHNNTQSFDYRPIGGTNRFSKHASGPIEIPIMAIDINPKQNPYIRDGITDPTHASYDPKAPGTLVSGGHEVKLFKRFGFSWGGDWKHPNDKPKVRLVDYMHFEKG